MKVYFKWVLYWLLSIVDSIVNCILSILGLLFINSFPRCDLSTVYLFLFVSRKIDKEKQERQEKRENLNEKADNMANTAREYLLDNGQDVSL